MALSQVYTAIAGHVITAARWNNEFGNIYANGTDVAFPLTKAVSLAGFTLTLDGAGVTTLSSTASQALILTPGSKSGTPSINGTFFQVAAATFTDSNTAGSGTCAVWNGSTIRAPTLAASNTLVTTTDASTVHIEAGPTAGTNETLTGAWALSTGGSVKVGSNSSRTNTVDTPLVVESVTTGIPAAGIGTGILLRAESQDENPSDVGQIDFTFSDRTAASEDSYCQILLRVAGAALTAAYRFAATTAFRAIFTHANTADRTYTLPDRNNLLDVPDTLEYLTSGTSWTVPAGVTRVHVRVYGASGGGGGGGEGGNAANAGAAGGSGGVTSFNSGALSTTGGAGGHAGHGPDDTAAGAAGAQHGVGSGGTVNRTGGGQACGRGGAGGSESPGGVPHSGGEGGSGGDGGYVEAYVSVTPAGSVAYAIGAAGSAGAGGTGTAGSDGGAGTAGQAGCIVLQY